MEKNGVCGVIHKFFIFAQGMIYGYSSKPPKYMHMLLWNYLFTKGRGIYCKVQHLLKQHQAFELKRKYSFRHLPYNYDESSYHMTSKLRELDKGSAPKFHMNQKWRQISTCHSCQTLHRNIHHCSFHELRNSFVSLDSNQLDVFFKILSMGL